MVEQSPAANTGDPRAGQGRRFSAGAIAALVGVGLLIAFMIQNTEAVTVQFLFWSVTLRIWLLTLVAALLGALVWIGLGVMRRYRRRNERRDDRRD